jgi:hypothetical protein
MHASPPASGPLTDWLREEARQPFEAPRGDQGDQLPLQWLIEFMGQDPSLAKRVAGAVEELLGESDSRVTERILTIAALPEASPTLRSAVANAIGRHADTLAKSAGVMGEPLLAAALRSLQTNRFTKPLSNETIAALEKIERPEEGWPLSVLIGLFADGDRFVGRLVPTLLQLGDEQMDRFVGGLLACGGEALVRVALERIGREAPKPLRQKVAKAVKAKHDELADAREQLVRMGVKVAPADPRKVVWARYAGWLGISP